MGKFFQGPLFLSTAQCYLVSVEVHAYKNEVYKVRILISTCVSHQMFTSLIQAVNYNVDVQS